MGTSCLLGCRGFRFSSMSNLSHRHTRQRSGQHRDSSIAMLHQGSEFPNDSCRQQDANATARWCSGSRSTSSGNFAHFLDLEKKEEPVYWSRTVRIRDTNSRDEAKDLDTFESGLRSSYAEHSGCLLAFEW